MTAIMDKPAPWGNTPTADTIGSKEVGWSRYLDFTPYPLANQETLVSATATVWASSPARGTVGESDVTASVLIPPVQTTGGRAVFSLGHVTPDAVYRVEIVAVTSTGRALQEQIEGILCPF